ncbi:PAS domain S-box protein [Candidatus Bathyarchaeota archaeon]|nr:PAS domain S-box protein [Candidatus Bathyarchaeota archaeon]
MGKLLSFVGFRLQLPEYSLKLIGCVLMVPVDMMRLIPALLMEKNGKVSWINAEAIQKLASIMGDIMAPSKLSGMIASHDASNLSRKHLDGQWMNARPVNVNPVPATSDDGQLKLHIVELTGENIPNNDHWKELPIHDKGGTICHFLLWHVPMKRPERVPLNDDAELAMAMIKETSTALSLDTNLLGRLELCVDLIRRIGEIDLAAMYIKKEATKLILGHGWVEECKELQEPGDSGFRKCVSIDNVLNLEKEGGKTLEGILFNEGFTSVTSLHAFPLVFNKNLLGLLVIGTKSAEEIPTSCKLTLEAISSQMQSAIHYESTFKRQEYEIVAQESILEDLDIGFLKYDEHGRISLASKGAARIMQCNQGDLLGKQVQSFIACISDAYGQDGHALLFPSTRKEFETVIFNGNMGRIAVRCTSCKVPGASNHHILEFNQLDGKIREPIEKVTFPRPKNLVTRIAMEFMNVSVEGMDASINTMMEMLCESLNINSCTIYLKDPEKTHRFMAKHQWNKQGEMGNNFPSTVTFPRKLDFNTKIINIYDPKYKSEETLVLESIFSLAWAKSAILLPLKVGNENLGFIGCARILEHSTWLKKEIEFLLTAASLFGSALHRQQYETMIMDSEERYKALIKTSPNLIILVDENEIIVDINQDEIFNTETQAFIGESIEKVAMHFSLNVPFITEKMESIMEGDFITPFYFEILVDGNKHWIETRASAVHFGNTCYYQLVLMDITNRIKADILAKERDNKVNQLEELRTQFLYRASHELKTPLNAIHGAVQIINNFYVEEITDDLKHLLDIINQGSTRLQLSIEQIIDSMNLETGYLSLEQSMANIVDLVEDCLIQFEEKFESRNIMLSFESPPEITLFIDEGRIRQVFSELVENALKNSQWGGTISVKVKRNNGAVQVSVQDSGVGLTFEEMNKLFKKFGKIERYGKGFNVITEGHGFGLYLAKEIVETHGGRIWAESPGRNMGATFIFELPRVPVINTRE